MGQDSDKVAYVCGPLTELGRWFLIGWLVGWFVRWRIKRFYSKIADVCEEVLGKRAFVPHEHFDPIKHAHFTPQQVYENERTQVCEKTKVLIVVAVAPSWGGGIEVQMANHLGVPIIVLHPENKKISRLLRGIPVIVEIIPYASQKIALWSLRAQLDVCILKARWKAA